MTMSTWREPQTYNSQGLVRMTDSLNSSQAKLISKSGSDSSLDSSQEEIVPKLFLAMSNGLHPSLITEMFQSFKSSKQVTQFLTNIFTHGLKTDQVEMSIILAKQFHSHKYYTRAMASSMEVLLKTHTMLDTGQLVRLVSDVYQRLGSLRDNLTPLLVDTLVKWVSPTMDRKKEVMLAVKAKNLIKQTGHSIVQSSVSGYRLVFAQVRAGLVGDKLVAETRAVLLDIVVIMGRQQEVERGGKETFVVDCDQKVNVKDYVTDTREELLEQSVNSNEDINQQMHPQGQVEEGKVEIGNGGSLHGSGYACTYATDVEKIKVAIKMKIEDKASQDIEPDVTIRLESGQIELISPAMFEESLGQDDLPASQENLLGHLVCKETGIAFPVSDLCTIGRDSSCSIMLPGREVSRLHARVFLREGKVIMETVSKVNMVRINGIIVNQVASLKEGDRVQVGKEGLVWHREGVRQKEDISEDTLWGEKDSPENVSEGVAFEVVNEDKCSKESDEDVDEATSDTDNVVVEMINFCV